MKRRTTPRTLRNPETYAPLLAIRDRREYDAAVARLNDLVDEIGDNPRDPRYRFIETLSLLIEAYDEKHHEIPDATGVELLKFLMEQHGLRQGDLPEVGSQGVVSEILRGKRELNVRQIRALSKRFHLPPEAFIPRAEQARLIRSARGKLRWKGDLEAMRADRRAAR
jgi:HTH-type transcriptional regulator/antitoxin HigA